MFTVNFELISHLTLSVSIVDFEHVFVCWAGSTVRLFMSTGLSQSRFSTTIGTLISENLFSALKFIFILLLLYDFHTKDAEQFDIIILGLCSHKGCSLPKTRFAPAKLYPCYT